MNHFEAILKKREELDALLNNVVELVGDEDFVES